MSEATLPRAHRSERRPLGARVWFVWMVAMWAVAFRAERRTIENAACAPTTRAGIR